MERKMLKSEDCVSLTALSDAFMDAQALSEKANAELSLTVATMQRQFEALISKNEGDVIIPTYEDETDIRPLAVIDVKGKCCYTSINGISATVKNGKMVNIRFITDYGEEPILRFDRLTAIEVFKSALQYLDSH